MISNCRWSTNSGLIFPGAGGGTEVCVFVQDREAKVQRRDHDQVICHGEPVVLVPGASPVLNGVNGFPRAAGYRLAMPRDLGFSGHPEMPYDVRHAAIPSTKDRRIRQ